MTCLLSSTIGQVSKSRVYRTLTFSGFELGFRVAQLFNFYESVSQWRYAVNMNRRQTLLVLAGFAAGVSAAVVIPPALDLATRVIFEQRKEVQRLTSPDGTVDAVVDDLSCGAPCGFAYALSIVRKGAPAAKDSLRQVFLADDVVNLQVRWREPHLLDVAYDRALILNFSNVAYPLAKPGNVESWHYEVEVHLSPSAPRFSYLPDTSALTSQ